MPTTDQTKPFKSYDEQIALLRERGLIITDDVYARDVLKRMNYYRFSAYSLTLRENDRFFPEVTLQDMVALYDFDQEFMQLSEDGTVSCRGVTELPGELTSVQVRILSSGDGSFCLFYPEAQRLFRAVPNS